MTKPNGVTVHSLTPFRVGTMRSKAPQISLGMAASDGKPTALVSMGIVIINDADEMDRLAERAAFAAQWMRDHG